MSKNLDWISLDSNSDWFGFEMEISNPNFAQIGLAKPKSKPHTKLSLLRKVLESKDLSQCIFLKYQLLIF